MASKEDALKAFLDYARQNLWGFSGVVSKTAAAAIRQFADEGMNPGALFMRVIHSSDPEILFGVLYDKVSRDSERRLALLDAVVTASVRVWDGVLDVKVVGRRFSTAEDFEHLLHRHRDALLYTCDENALMCQFSSDAYWKKRVRWYIAKRDWRRAWDELGKAERGFFIGHKEDAPRFGEVDLTWYVHAASQKSLAPLVPELFNAMRIHDLFQPLVSEDPTLAEVEMARMMTDHSLPLGWVEALDFSRRLQCGSLVS